MHELYRCRCCRALDHLRGCTNRSAGPWTFVLEGVEVWPLQTTLW